MSDFYRLGCITPFALSLIKNQVSIVTVLIFRGFTQADTGFHRYKPKVFILLD